MSFERLLFIEDDPAQRELTTRLYQMCRKVFHDEVEFLTAPSWETGLAIIHAKIVDVLICDLTLPPMAKEDTLMAIKTTVGLPPVIVLTGNEADPDLRRKCFESGCDDFVLKSDVNHKPEWLCERAYHSFLRHEPRA